MRLLLCALVFSFVACNASKSATTTLSTEAAQGQAIFQKQCALCHPTDDGRAQGPGLANVFGRAAASNPGFRYTKALQECGLTWDAATLDQFLTNPISKVPGTIMVATLPDAAQRRAVIAYLETLRSPPAPH